MRKALIEKLHAMQKWRRGHGSSMPFTSREFGIAIDDCIRLLRGLSDEQVNRILNGKTTETDTGGIWQW
jgi:hypothetical protein